MATTYYQPGVYVQEIDTPQVTIQSAPTAIPAFIGYTQKAQALNPGDLVQVPTLITSLLDYVRFFGMGPGPSVKEIVLDSNNNFVSADVTIPYRMYDAISLFYQNGGGNAYIVSAGVFPVASPSKNDFLGTGTLANPGCLEPLKKFQQPTLLVFPDNDLLGPDWFEVYQAALQQSATMQSTFTLLDFYYNETNKNFTYQTAPSIYNYSNEVAAYRGAIGINNLNYGAAYGPWIDVLPSQSISFGQVKNIYAGGVHVSSLRTLTSDTTIQTAIISLEELVADINTIQAQTNALLGSESTALSVTPGFTSLSSVYTYLQSLVSQAATGASASSAVENLFNLFYNLGAVVQGYVSGTAPAVLTNGGLVDYLDNAGSSNSGFIKSQLAPLYLQLKSIENAILAAASPFGTGNTYSAQNTVFTTADSAWKVSGINVISGAVTAATIPNFVASATTTALELANAQAIVAAINSAGNQIIAQYADILSEAQSMESTQQAQLASIFPVYAAIVNGINNTPIALPPSGAIAGIYANVDNTLGVWKAPANVSVNGVVAPDWRFANTEYDDLNIDLNAGKSINAIRAFTGKGTLVWGARTLAGNDTHWRYVSVRRFFIMVEQAVKNALGAYVFEPNDANTWTTVIAEVNSYLFGLWRAGALMGTNPAQAYSVQCGLGSTMTADDILNGKMIVTIGMAVVRPAEFIVLQFTQNVQATSGN